jgi:hypothetical protein
VVEVKHKRGSVVSPFSNKKMAVVSDRHILGVSIPKQGFGNRRTAIFPDLAFGLAPLLQGVQRIGTKQSDQFIGALRNSKLEFE